MENNGKYFVPLVALWAFVESGLGGMMHALHLPFTGLFLGGFSVISISLIGRFENKAFSQILKATLIVMVIKASVNPATSPMAYIAVGFQGLLGAILYSIPKKNIGIDLSFSVIAMIESAFQKFLVLTIIFGTAWFQAIDKFFHSILKSIGLHDDFPFAKGVIIAYIALYFIWGFLLGIWINRIPKQIQLRKHLYKDLKSDNIQIIKQSKNKSKYLKIFALIAVIIFFSCFFIPDKDPWIESLTLILRTVSIVTIWLIFVAPLWKKLISKLQERKIEETPLVLEKLDYLKTKVKPLYSLVSNDYNGLKKWKEFILGLLVISLNDNES